MPDMASIPLFAGGPPQSDQIYLQNLGASRDYAEQMRWQQSGGNSTLEWAKRTFSQDYGSDLESPLIPAEEARARLKQEAVTFDIPDEGIREATFQSKIKRQYDINAARDAIQRGPHDVVSEMRGVAIELARQAIDPINIAAAFIPIVGEVRMAEMLAAAGTGWAARAGVFARVGAIEGVVGTALLEPPMHYMASRLQEDYTMADSLLNIAFGGAIGGGLHVGVGTIKDWHAARAGTVPPGDIPNLMEVQARGEIPEKIAAMDRDTRIEIGRAALAQAIDGRDVDIAPMLDLADITQRATAAERQPGFLKSAEDLLAQRQEDRLRATPGFLQTGLDKLALRELDEANAETVGRIQERIATESQAQIAKIEEARARELTRQIQAQSPDVTTQNLANLLESQQIRSEVLADNKRLAALAKERDLTPKELRDKLERMQRAGERDLGTYRQAALSSFPEARQRAATTHEQVQNLAKAAQSPESGIPREALQLSEEADRLVKDESTPADQPDSTTARTMLQDAENELKRFVPDEASLKEAFPTEDAAIKQAKDDQKILTALAECHLRKG